MMKLTLEEVHDEVDDEEGEDKADDRREDAPLAQREPAGCHART